MIVSMSRPQVYLAKPSPPHHYDIIAAVVKYIEEKEIREIAVVLVGPCKRRNSKSKVDWTAKIKCYNNVINLIKPFNHYDHSLSLFLPYKPFFSPSAFFIHSLITNPNLQFCFIVQQS
ncbi:hypothetical protein EPI10_033154 [Gossypium australe]|uniref:Uncharacterized protein n=1 Tax=Gossypium australe TaxID=47621 RepID=A0A5B6X725_9ROSI|nr:hypothetical protein EPI10_033154 [Gossypium australe]